MTSLAALVCSFAGLLMPAPANEAALKDWAEAARACDLPNMHAFTRGLDLDIDAAIAAVTLPFHNGRAEGVNTKTKMMIKRQMRSGCFPLRASGQAALPRFSVKKAASFSVAGPTYCSLS